MSMYTREHYEDIARILGEQRAEAASMPRVSLPDWPTSDVRLGVLQDVTNAFVSRFAADNANFSPARFRARIMEVEHAPQDR